MGISFFLVLAEILYRNYAEVCTLVMWIRSTAAKAQDTKKK